MKSYYYVHLTSWLNNESDYYRHNNEEVGGFVFAESVGDILHTLIKTESREGYSPRSERLLKVTANQLNAFKEKVQSFQIEDSNVYNLNSLLQLSEDILRGCNVRMRYRKSIHFCEEILASLETTETQRHELRGMYTRSTKSEERMF